MDFGGGADTTFSEWTPFVRYFWFKEGDDGAPVSVASHAQYVHDDYSGIDKGWYVLGGGDVFKKLRLSDGFALYPYLGFSVAAESFRFGGASADRSAYLTRQFGVHAQFALGGRGMAPADGGGAGLPSRNVSRGAAGLCQEVLSGRQFAAVIAAAGPAANAAHSPF